MSAKTKASTVNDLLDYVLELRQKLGGDSPVVFDVIDRTDIEDIISENDFESIPLTDRVVNDILLSLENNIIRENTGNRDILFRMLDELDTGYGITNKLRDDPSVVSKNDDIYDDNMEEYLRDIGYYD